MSQSVVSIIMRTTGNRPILLDRAIKSVLNQSFSDFSLVIVNDGGKTSSVDKAANKHIAKSQDRITFINKKVSEGRQSALNTGIQSLTSKYIACLDDDDSWHPDFLAETITFLEKHRQDGVVTGSMIIWEDIVGDEIRIIDQQFFNPDLKAVSYFNLLGTGQFPNNSFVYSRNAYKKIGGYAEVPETDMLEDWEFSIRFMREFDLGYINKPLSYYHRRPDQKGSMGNSIFVEGDQSRINKITILNKHIREDLETGKLGIGTLMNLSENLRLEKEKTQELYKKIKAADDKIIGLDKKLDKQLEVIRLFVEQTNNSLFKKARRSITKQIKNNS